MLDAPNIFHDKRIRFILVGGLNTLVDFLIYTTLRLLGVNLVVANFISTSCGMAVSYTLNRNFTFKSTSSKKRKEIVLFISVTAFGLWILQPLVITALEHTLNNAHLSLISLLITIIPKA